MKAIVIYYSQTGNTKKIAEAVARGVEAENGQCDLRRFRDISAEMLAEYDLVGIGTPVWGSCPTLNVVDFIEKLPSSFAGKEFFYFCTHGMTPGRAILRAIGPMYRAGLTVLGWKDWYGGASLPGHLKPWFTDGHPDEIDLAEAEVFGAQMVQHSRSRANGEDVLPTPPTPEESDYVYGIGHPFLFGEDMPEPEMPEDMPPLPPPEAFPPLKYPTTLAYSMALEGKTGPDLNAMAPPARIDPALCVGCNRCVEACFCDNIDGTTKPPRIVNPYCEHCYFCEGVCPTGAMQFVFRPAAKSKEEVLEHLGAYRKILNDAEARGQFRRHVRDEEIGWTTPWELVTSHPRHKDIP